MASHLQPRTTDDNDEIKLDGSNYGLWMPHLKSLLNEQKLWGFITGEQQKPTQMPDETSQHYKDRLREWDCANQRIIDILKNTCRFPLRLSLNSFKTAKEAWDFLAKRFASDGARQSYFLKKVKFHRICTDQSIYEFHGHMKYIWEKLSVFEPEWCCTEDAERFRKYKDNLKLLEFLNALDPDFEPIKETILGRHILPSFDEALPELMFEESRLELLELEPSDGVMSSSPNSPHSQPLSRPKRLCAYCDRWGHCTDDCHKLEAIQNESVELILADMDGFIDRISPDTVALKSGVIASCITSIPCLIGLVSLIYNKAVWLDSTFCSMYASLCKDLSTKTPSVVINEPGGKKITFTALLLEECLKEFEGAQGKEPGDKEKSLKHRAIGNIHLIGELQKQGMVPEWMVHSIVSKLLGDDDTTSCPEETNVEGVCLFLTAIGEELDWDQKSKRVNDMYFSRLKDWSTNPELAASLRLMVGNVLDLRSKNWVRSNENPGGANDKSIQESRASTSEGLPGSGCVH